MRSLIYFALICIQFISVLATQPVIPLKCFLQDNKFFDIFDKSSVQLSQKTRTAPQVNNINVKSVLLEKHGFAFDAKDVDYQGLDKAVLDEFGFNFVYNISKVTFHTDLHLKCPYKTNGTLFSLPIYGDGIINTFIKNIEFGLTMPFEIIKVDGNSFIKLKEFFYYYNTKDYAQFNLDNLYDGNKEQSQTMHYLMNQNWKYMMTRFADMFMEKVADNVFNVFKNYMLSVPLKSIDNC